MIKACRETQTQQTDGQTGTDAMIRVGKAWLFGSVSIMCLVAFIGCRSRCQEDHHANMNIDDLHGPYSVQDNLRKVKVDIGELQKWCVALLGRYNRHETFDGVKRAYGSIGAISISPALLPGKLRNQLVAVLIPSEQSPDLLQMSLVLTPHEGMAVWVVFENGGDGLCVGSSESKPRMDGYAKWMLAPGVYSFERLRE